MTAPVIQEPLLTFLRTVRHRLVVVGSVARGVRWPKDLDLLMDLDSKLARTEIQKAVERNGLQFESPFLGSWTFKNYGWMVEILGTHHGPDFRVVRRRATTQTIAGIEFFVARPEDAPR